MRDAAFRMRGVESWMRRAEFGMRGVEFRMRGVESWMRWLAFHDGRVE
jgi:hypothetical protein